MAKEGKWWSYPCEAENGRTIIVTGHDGLEKQMASGKYIYRVEVRMAYSGTSDGMPDTERAETLEKVTEAFHNALAEDKIAVLTGIYTGDDRRDWVFYTKSLRIFNSFFNRALSGLPVLDFEIIAEEDPGWKEYLHMKEETYIPEED